jgi:RNA ligase
MSNSTHRVNVVRVEEILPHNGADTLGIVHIGGYQCVVKKDLYKVGDLALYIQPDTIVPVLEPFKFLWADREFADGTIPERLRRITVRRFRKEWSEGLLMPIADFQDLYKEATELTSAKLKVAEGDDVAELLGFTHYEEPEPMQNTQLHGKQYKGLPKSLRGWFFYILAKLHIYRPAVYGVDCTKAPKQFAPIYDVEAYKNYPRTFTENEQVIVTEKIHGSNARYQFSDGKMHVGSHNYWKSEKSTCVWRKALAQHPWIEKTCRMFPDFTLYTEVSPTQKGYTYGSTGDEIKVFVFDMLKPDGTYCHKKDLIDNESAIYDHLAPVLYAGPFDWEKIKALVEGPSTVPGAKHIREGIVISSATERIVRGLGRAQLKIKSMKFLEKENA